MESASGTQIGRVPGPIFFFACGALKGACGLFLVIIRQGPDPQRKHERKTPWYALPVGVQVATVAYAPSRALRVIHGVIG